MTRLLALLALCSASCMQVGTQTGTGGGGATGDSGLALSGDGGAGGTSCGSDPQTGVTLCLGTSACPGMSIDTSAFPGCGFRQGGPSAIDLECLCAGGALCPIGVPTTCDAVAELLTQQQSALQVCQQVASGSCLVPDAGGGTSSGSSGGLSSACSTCVASCGGTPSCYEACGC